ncbi:MAG: restriction endonuclease subunit S [Desmonostoc vinosum HA7617-LM4]|jgi:type I restriction enzyme S subunit|nr:restriction endonuclease subunit S [Desmonostoc vinosum HA7617-LM4]
MSSWTHQPICSLGTVVTGSTPKTSEAHLYGGDIPFVTPAELDKFAPVITAARTLSEIGGSEARLLPEGTVMVCCIGSLGKIGIAGRTVATNQQINSVVFDTRLVLPRFGFYACRRLKSKLVTMAPATTVAIVNKSKFEQLEIPVPPLEEQRRIAEILDRAQYLISKRREAIAQLDTLTQTIFIEMFGDPVTNPKGWEVRKMNECAERIQIGPFGTQLHEEDYIDNGIPLVNPTHIQDGKIFANTSFSISNEKHQQLGQYHLEVDDVILGRRGEMGRCAIVSKNEHEWLCGTGSLFIRPTNTLINSVYLFSILSNQSIKKYLEKASQGVTMANLNKTIVSQIPVVLPPLSLQQKFAYHVESVEKLKVAHRASLSELNTLFTSLQHRAFRGEL